VYIRKTLSKRVEVVASVVCNVCSQVIIEEGRSGSYAILKASWGYYSKKDLEYHEAHICEPCYDNHITPLFEIPAYCEETMPFEMPKGE
jgi:hypothetical protein